VGFDILQAPLASHGQGHDGVLWLVLSQHVSSSTIA
jgi:hypothetical protein